jgi:hypothetical protein
MLKAYVRIWQGFVCECCLWSGFQNHLGNLENLPASADCSTGIFSLILRQWLSVVGLVFFLLRTQNIHSAVPAYSFCGNVTNTLLVSLGDKNFVT